MTTTYDYIICGAGCAGLSLVMHLLAAPPFTDKKILLVDKAPKNSNDRTWCFWEREPGLFEPIVYKQWQQLWFYNDEVAKPLSIAPYTYKLIRGIDFYNYGLEAIRQHPHITFLQAEVEAVYSTAGKTGIVAGGKTYESEYVFNSLLLSPPRLKPHQYWLLQHFTGWVIEAETPVFDPASATLMDFRTSQANGTTFFYVLPFTDKKALVEYTLFSEKLLDKEAYEKALQQYIGQQLHLEKYTVHEKEFGVIPMTNYPFPATDHHILNIGTAGGQTKASSGYTFRFIQKQSAAIVRSLQQQGHPFGAVNKAGRAHFYDSILLHILHHQKLQGADIFTELFLKNKADQVLQFLDNETSILQEIAIIRTLPTLPFLQAAVHQLTRSVI